MLAKLLLYNWKIFKGKLTTAKVLVLITYGILLLLVFWNALGVIISLVFAQENDLLYQQLGWLNQSRAAFLLFVFANILWVSQLIFTNVRQLQLEENRKLLTVGFPVSRLAGYLTFLAFFHPMNLLFNTVWIIYLYAQMPGMLHLPVILAIVLLNYAVIFSIKFRFLNLVKDHHKWILLVSFILIFLFGLNIQQYLNTTSFNIIDEHLPLINAIAGGLPGGLLQHSTTFTEFSFSYFAIFVFAAGGSVLLFKDHYKNTRKALQTPAISRQSNKKSSLWKKLYAIFGLQGGKFLYYVFSHPYNRVQALFFILFPLIYLPFAMPMSESGGNAENFIVLFFMMYIPLGFLLLCVGNLFGYEQRELLLHLQLPIDFDRMITDRYISAVIVPTFLFLVVTIGEVILFFESPYLLSYILGNLFIFLFLLSMFSWSAFNNYQKIPWVSFRFTQPVVSKSVATVTSLIMVVLGAIAFIPFGEYELYKQLVLATGILIMVYALYYYFSKLQQIFKSNIQPQLWNEL